MLSFRHILYISYDDLMYTLIGKNRPRFSHHISQTSQVTKGHSTAIRSQNLSAPKRGRDR